MHGCGAHWTCYRNVCSAPVYTSADGSEETLLSECADIDPRRWQPTRGENRSIGSRIWCRICDAPVETSPSSGRSEHISNCDYLGAEARPAVSVEGVAPLDLAGRLARGSLAPLPEHGSAHGVKFHRELRVWIPYRVRGIRCKALELRGVPRGLSGAD